jgi:hypothetical protein
MKRRAKATTRRFSTVERRAAYMRAESNAGAKFQLVLAGNAVAFLLADDEMDRFTPEQRRRLFELKSLIYSIAGTLPDTADIPPDLVRYYMADRDDPHRLAEDVSASCAFPPLDRTP